MNNIISVVVILTSFGLFFGYIDPTYSHIKELRLEKADYDRALDNSNDLQKEKRELSKRVEEMSAADREDLLKLLPDHIDNIRLIVDVNEMARTHNMSIKNLKTETSEKKETIGKDSSRYGTLTFKFTTSAPYNTFLAFIRDLEQSLRILDIASISFDANDNNPIHDFDVTIKTYWLK